MSVQPSDSAREDRVNEIIAAYLKAVQAGQAPDRREILAQHPDLAAELNSFFADQDQFHAVAGPLENVIVASSSSVPAGLAPTLGMAETSADDSGPEKVRYFGDYELLEEIARGDMGVVYRARVFGHFVGRRTLVFVDEAGLVPPRKCLRSPPLRMILAPPDILHTMSRKGASGVPIAPYRFVKRVSATGKGGRNSP
jgi:hypothetical protein